MIQELLEIKDTQSLPEMCDRFGAWLGVETPVPPRVLLRALDDEGYASDLITCRNAPAFLEALFTDPRNAAWEQRAAAAVAATPPSAATAAATSAEDAGSGAAGTPGNLELVGRAAQAFLRWGKAGFSTVDRETLERRENACLACPHLSEPDRLLQKLAGRAAAEEVGSRTGKRICGQCGCTVGRKMRLASESCPVAHPTLVGLTRWGEPVRKPD